MNQQFRIRSGLTIAVTMALATASFGAAPASAAPSHLSIEEERAVRGEMSDMGIATNTIDALVSELASGNQIESQRAIAVPTSTTVEETANGVREVSTFSDGSVRTVEQLSVSSTGPDGRVYVAHPTLECNLIHCTLIFSRADTKFVVNASSSSVASLLVAACGPLIWACAIGTAAVVSTARSANSSGKCVALQKVISVGPVYPVKSPCRR